MDLISGKIVTREVLKKDFIEIINRTKSIRSIEIVDYFKLADTTKVVIDVGYSTRLGYDRSAMKTTIKMLQENVLNPRINAIFNTEYTEEQLKDLKLLILLKSIEIEEEYVYSDNVDDKVPEFVLASISFHCSLKS